MVANAVLIPIEIRFNLGPNAAAFQPNSPACLTVCRDRRSLRGRADQHTHFVRLNSVFDPARDPFPTASESCFGSDVWSTRQPVGVGARRSTEIRADSSSSRCSAARPVRPAAG